MQRESLLVFYIETIPDATASSRMLGLEEVSEQEVRTALSAYHLEQSDGRTSFPKPPFHRVITIGVLLADPCKGIHQGHHAVRELLSRSAMTTEDEKQLLVWFFAMFERERPSLVSFNGRGFDLPVLRYRAMVHGVQCPLLYDSTNKWENYGSRYSIDWHCDLMDVLSDFGASPKVRLDEVCAALGLPGKLGIDGSQVASLFDAGKTAEIAGYCETDVLNSYAVYLRLMHHRGRLATSAYNASIDQLLEFVRSRAQASQHLRDFGVAWKRASSGTFGRLGERAAVPTRAG